MALSKVDFTFITLSAFESDYTIFYTTTERGQNDFYSIIHIFDIMNKCGWTLEGGRVLNNHFVYYKINPKR